MPELSLILQSVFQMRVQLPDTGVNRLKRPLSGVAEAERVAELSARQAQKAFDLILETLTPRETPLREDLEAAIRTELISFDARQRLDLAA